LINHQFSVSLPPCPEIWHETISAATGEVPVRIYLPSGKGPHPMMIYLHGGGWTIGDLDTAHATALQLSAKTGWVVISVDYRLAPEHPFPAALQDAYAVFRWCTIPENALSIRGDVNKIVIAGDSAGGNLAAALCLYNRDRQGPAIAGQLLIYPVLDLLHFDRASYFQYGSGHLLTAEDVPFFVRQYIADPLLATDPLVSPLLTADLNNLSPALIVTAEFDVLRTEAEEYAEKLKSAGISTRLFFAAGMEHGFFSMQHLIPRADYYASQILALLVEDLTH
jgi:acetyl esterase